MGRPTEHLRRLHEGYVRFVEKQGFFVIVAVCVAVIAGTALWTRREPAAPAQPTAPVSDEARQAAQVLQERLAEVATPSPAPTAAPVSFSAPLPETRVLQGFDATRLARVGSTALWRIHDACDLQCALGDVISAMADGVVVAVAEAGVDGASVTIDHLGGVTACYAGMSALTALRVGDPVRQGQSVGFAGKGITGEETIGPHLHLRVLREGQAVDPTLLWKK